MTTTARLTALSREVAQLARMDDARARAPEATALTRDAFEAYWVRMFDEWTAGYSEAERDAEAARWLALLEAGL